MGEALEELTGSAPETRIDELAHHWLSATQVADMAKAIRYARQAGDRAQENLAFEEAAAHYERALSVLAPHDRAGEELRCDLLLALGDVQRRAGSANYRDTVAKAVAAARALGDGERLARAALASSRPGGINSNANVVDEELHALYEEASAALGEYRGAAGDAPRARALIAAGHAEAEQLGMAREIVRFERLRERVA